MTLVIYMIKYLYTQILRYHTFPYIPINTSIHLSIPIYTHTYPYIPIHTHLYPYLPINTYPYLCISMVVVGPPIIYLPTSKTIEKRGSKNVTKIKGVNWWQIHTHRQRRNQSLRKILPTLQVCLSLIFLSYILSIYKVLYL